MKFAKLDTDVYLLRLDRGDRILETIQDFAKANAITNASVQGIGSVEEPTLAHYSVDTRHFTEANFEGIYEVTSLLGNIGLIKDEPVPHLHVTISAEEMHTHGGHLRSGTASATLEVIITVYPTDIAKSLDEAVGLNIWDI